MNRFRNALRHPFWQAVILLIAAYVAFEFGIAYVPPLFGMESAPIPNSVLLQYMLTALVGILIYVSDNEERWRQFKEPIARTLVDPSRRWLRGTMLVTLPVLAGFVTYDKVRPKVTAPIQLRSVHPAPPARITFRGRQIDLTALENPLRSKGSLDDHYERGKSIYYQNCLPCHGDLLDGRGHYAHAFNPVPLPFDKGTIAQLRESFVFWRIAKGGPGLPVEGTPWNSAMPVWENFLTEEEIWSVSIFLYEQAGLEPRRLGAEEGSEEREEGNAKSEMGTENEETGNGKKLYDKWCAECHGETGAGDGPAASYMLPRPRDFTRALYQVRTTASGELPTDDDIRRVIDAGMPGTAMPGWEAKLSASERDQLVTYVKSFSRFFGGAEPEPLEFGSPPRGGDRAIEEGRSTYEKLECFKCHGQEGRGDGQSAPTLVDDWDFPIRAKDLTQPWMFNGGPRVEDIYRRLRTGLDGTPMPSFSDAVDAGVITDEELWRVAQYVASLSSGKEPPVADVLRARLVEGELPTTPEDDEWNGTGATYVPLAGQIIAAPRWFAPMVDGIWVQALHDGTTLALKLSWHDPSASPDPAWQEWLERVAKAMPDVDGPIPIEQGPDRLHLQFPAESLEGMELPYFLGGDGRRPVFQWRWSSAPDTLLAGTATGIDRFRPSDARSEATHAARFNDGRWELVIVRALAPLDSLSEPVFSPGRAIPIAFFVSDGSNGEDEVRGAVSAWLSLHLEVPTPATAFVWPLFATLLTAGLGLTVVTRARRRFHTSETSKETLQ